MRTKVEKTVTTNLSSTWPHTSNLLQTEISKKRYKLIILYRIQLCLQQISPYPTTLSVSILTKQWTGTRRLMGWITSLLTHSGVFTENPCMGEGLQHNFQLCMREGLQHNFQLCMCEGLQHNFQWELCATLWLHTPDKSGVTSSVSLTQYDKVEFFRFNVHFFEYKHTYFHNLFLTLSF